MCVKCNVDARLKVGHKEMTGSKRVDDAQKQNMPIQLEFDVDADVYDDLELDEDAYQIQYQSLQRSLQEKNNERKQSTRHSFEKSASKYQQKSNPRLLRCTEHVLEILYRVRLFPI